MRTKSFVISHATLLILVILSASEGYSQNVGIGTVTPAYPLDVNGVINSASEYRLSGKTVFRWGNLSFGLYRNFSAGDSAGSSNTTGFENTFIGGGAGAFNLTGDRNCFLGSHAGHRNIIDNDNTYIGASAGENSGGSLNTYVGSASGMNSGNASYNTFLGYFSGGNIITGSQNTFLGAIAGYGNQTGSHNVFVGQLTGNGITTGSGNTAIGALADFGSSSLSRATAIGYSAYVTQSNSIVLGSIAGVNGATADTWVGIGTTAPTEKLDVAGNIKVSGEVNHVSTGTTNLLPVAFGSIASGGAINSGSTNFTVTRTAAGSYTIDITDQSYSLSAYTTTITAVGTPLVPVSNSASGNLLVRLYNLSGVLTDGTFHFVVHKQ